jgi:hypothetical protein
VWARASTQKSSKTVNSPVKHLLTRDIINLQGFCYNAEPTPASRRCRVGDSLFYNPSSNPSSFGPPDKSIGPFFNSTTVEVGWTLPISQFQIFLHPGREKVLKEF